MKGIQVRKGAILLWRLGQLNYGDQASWDRAPERKGMWAFPWPFYEAGFTEHQFNYYMPKRLRVDDNGWPLDPSVFAYPDGSKPSTVERDADGYPLDENLDVPLAFWEARADWTDKVGRRVLPLRKFWYSGDVFTHIPGHKAYGVDPWLFLDEWHVTASSDLGSRLNTASRQLANRAGEKPLPGRRIPSRAAGAMELFLAPGMGRIS